MGKNLLLSMSVAVFLSTIVFFAQGCRGAIKTVPTFKVLINDYPKGYIERDIMQEGAASVEFSGFIVPDDDTESASQKYYISRERLNGWEDEYYMPWLVNGITPKIIDIQKNKYEVELQAGAFKVETDLLNVDMKMKYTIRNSAGYEQSFIIEIDCIKK